MDDLGVLYNLEGKYAAAEVLLSKVSEGRQRALGGNHKDTLRAQSMLALAISYLSWITTPLSFTVATAGFTFLSPSNFAISKSTS